MKPQNLKQTFGNAPVSAPALVTPTKSRKPTKAAQAAPSALTEVAARIDVGLGNSLFIRGQGDGLSWEKGKPLRCQNASTWVWSSAQAREKLVFKLLLNDAVWARGEDIVIEAGRKIEVVPQF